MTGRANNSHSIFELSTKRLVTTVPPLEGETLISLLVRTSEANVFGGPLPVLQLADTVGARAAFAAFGEFGNAARLAALLEQDVSQIELRMHPPAAAGRTDRVVYFGLEMPRRFLEASVRRVSPAGLRMSPHGRAAWILRPLDFCPETVMRLIDRCPDCGAQLQWDMCRSVWRCCHCDASLAAAKPVALPEALRDEARAVAALLSHVASERQAAAAATPAPFRDWPPAEIFEAVVEFGLAATTAPEAVIGVDRKQARGCATLSVEQLVAGHHFLQSWPSSFEAYLAERYNRAAWINQRGCLGTLARHLRPSANSKRFAQLIQAAYPPALDRAQIPCRIFPESKVGVGARRSSISAVEAERRFGIMRFQLRRLEFRSPIHLRRGPARGGTCLYAREGIERLARLSAETLSEEQAARRLGVPVHAIPRLVEADHLGSEADADLRLVYGDQARIRVCAVERLRKDLNRLPEHEGRGVPLRAAMRHQYSPQAWPTLIGGLLDQRLRVIGRAQAGAPLERMFVCLEEVRAALAGLPEEPASGEVSCRVAAEMLGATQQFVAAAVRAGFLAGAVAAPRSAIPLPAVRDFDRRVVIAKEAAERLNCRPAQTRHHLRALGLSPIAVLNRVAVWDRRSFEEALVPSASESNSPE
jgi:hypothetical protein